MIVAQSAATARIYAARHHQRPDENADLALAGLSAANVAAALSGPDRRHLTEAIRPSRVFDTLHEALRVHRDLDSEPRL